MNRSSVLPHICSVSERKSEDRPVENRDPDLRSGTGASWIVISLLPLGAGIWVAVASLTSAALRLPSSPASPRNSLGIAFNQRSDQVQERLMLGMSAASTQKRADIDIGHLSA